MGLYNARQMSNLIANYEIVLRDLDRGKYNTFVYFCNIRDQIKSSVFLKDSPSKKEIKLLTITARELCAHIVTYYQELIGINIYSKEYLINTHGNTKTIETATMYNNLYKLFDAESKKYMSEFSIKFKQAERKMGNR